MCRIVEGMSINFDQFMEVIHQHQEIMQNLEQSVEDMKFKLKRERAKRREAQEQLEEQREENLYNQGLIANLRHIKLRLQSELAICKEELNKHVDSFEAVVEEQEETSVSKGLSEP